MIAKSPENVIVFVEVKARRNDVFGSGGAAVTPAKQRKIIRTAKQYIFDYRLSWEGDFRFDVILFEKDRMEHMVHAFF